MTDGSPVLQTITPAEFNFPAGVTVDAAGNLYVGDLRNNKVRMITPHGIVSTFAGSGSEVSADGTGTAASFVYPTGLAFDAAGDLYVAEQGNMVRKITPDAVVTTFAGSTNAGSADGTGTAAQFNSPTYVTFDAAGDLYVVDGSNQIRKITPDAVVTTFAGSTTAGSADGTGTAAQFNSPRGVAVDAAGNLHVADLGNHKIRRITPDAVVTTFAGSGSEGSADGTGTAASFVYPTGLAFDAAGNLYVADQGNHKIRRIAPNGVVSTFAGSATKGSADGTGTAASFDTPTGLAFDVAGNLYVADQGNHKIRKITPGGVVTTIAGSGSAGSTDETRAGSVSTDDGGVAVTNKRCYRLVLTLTDRASISAGYMSEPVTIARPAPAATLACTPSTGPTNAAALACTAEFSGEPAPGSSLTAGEVLIGGTATGWVADDPVGTGAGPYSFSVVGGLEGTLSAAIAAGAIVSNEGDDSLASETLVWTIDRTAPSASSLAATPRTGSALSGTTIPLTLTWWGADNAGGSGIARYELERSTNGGAYTVVSTSLTTKSASVVSAASGAVRYRVRAIDTAGNPSAWTYTSTLSPRLTQQSSSAVRYATTWALGSSSSYSGGSVRYAKTTGRSVSYTFTGRSIALVTSKSASRGKVKVYVNGVYQMTVDTYRSASQYRVVAWQKTWSTSATRTIKLVVVGTSGRPRVDLDAFVVMK